LSAAAPGAAVQPLDMNAVATVAVLNNPDLAGRARESADRPGAGLRRRHPANPELTANFDRQSEAGAPSGYGLGIATMSALILNPANVSGANARPGPGEARSSVAGMANGRASRNLYVQRINSSEKRELYAAAGNEIRNSGGALGRALQMGDVTFDTAGIDLAALLDVRSQLSTAERSASQRLFAAHLAWGRAAG